MMILAFVPVLLVAVLINSAVVVVDAYEREALTVFGEFREVLEPGINIVPPFVSETHAFDMRTQTVDVPQQEAITEDNSPVVANAVLYVRVMDAKRAFLEVEDYERAVSNLGQTTLRAVLGDMKLDETLHQRRTINERIRKEIAGPTDQWGVRIEAVEVQAINPSRDVVQSMEQQTSAERRRRAMILDAQGERRSDIERARGDRRADILEAEGEKQAEILEAQGEAISTVLRARAADSMGERAVIDRGMETLESIGAGESTTFVLPQETTSLLGRYGRHLTGSDVGDGTTLESGEFDAEDREMLGLDDIADIVDGIQDGEGDGEVRGYEDGAEVDAYDEASKVDDYGDGAEVEAIREADDTFDDGEDREVEDPERN
ncbi:phosphoesterase [Halobacteriales archaeon QS_8_69_26]|nr:MAG: phosphoesterase [Halobacteriales archaeon QS_8_69_26]